MKPGLYPVMSMAEYLGDPCPEPSLSSSLIHAICSRSAWHAWTASPKMNPNYVREEADRFDLGTAVHAYILEGAREIVVVDSPDWRTKAAKTQRAAAREVGRLALLKDQYAQVQAMAAALPRQLDAFDEPRPLTAGQPEQTLIWQEDGLWCRARLDWLHDSHTQIDDLKTVGGSANPATWSRTMFSMGYDIQEAWYRRGVKAVFGTEAAFRFIVLETDAPHAAAAVSLAPDAQDLADKKITYGMRVWRECLEADVWPGYPLATHYAELPPWEATSWGERLYQDTGGIVDDGRPLEDLIP